MTNFIPHLLTLKMRNLLLMQAALVLLVPLLVAGSGGLTWNDPAQLPESLKPVVKNVLTKRQNEFPKGVDAVLKNEKRNMEVISFAIRETEPQYLVLVELKQNEEATQTGVRNRTLSSASDANSPLQFLDRGQIPKLKKRSDLSKPLTTSATFLLEKEKEIEPSASVPAYVHDPNLFKKVFCLYFIQNTDGTYTFSSVDDVVECPAGRVMRSVIYQMRNVKNNPFHPEYFETTTWSDVNGNQDEHIQSVIAQTKLLKLMTFSRTMNAILIAENEDHDECIIVYQMQQAFRSDKVKVYGGVGVKFKTKGGKKIVEHRVESRIQIDSAEKMAKSWAETSAKQQTSMVRMKSEQLKEHPLPKIAQLIESAASLRPRERLETGLCKTKILRVYSPTISKFYTADCIRADFYVCQLLYTSNPEKLLYFTAVVETAGPSLRHILGYHEELDGAENDARYYTSTHLQWKRHAKRRGLFNTKYDGACKEQIKHIICERLEIKRSTKKQKKPKTGTDGEPIPTTNFLLQMSKDFPTLWSSGSSSSTQSARSGKPTLTYFSEMTIYPNEEDSDEAGTTSFKVDVLIYRTERPQMPDVFTVAFVRKQATNEKDDSAKGSSSSSEADIRVIPKLLYDKATALYLPETEFQKMYANYEKTNTANRNVQPVDSSVQTILEATKMYTSKSEDLAIKNSIKTAISFKPPPGVNGHIIHVKLLFQLSITKKLNSQQYVLDDATTFVIAQVGFGQTATQYIAYVIAEVVAGAEPIVRLFPGYYQTPDAAITDVEENYPFWRTQAPGGQADSSSTATKINSIIVNALYDKKEKYSCATETKEDTKPLAGGSKKLDLSTDVTEAISRKWKWNTLQVSQFYTIEDGYPYLYSSKIFQFENTVEPGSPKLYAAVTYSTAGFGSDGNYFITSFYLDLHNVKNMKKDELSRNSTAQSTGEIPVVLKPTPIPAELQQEIMGQITSKIVCEPPAGLETVSPEIQLLHGFEPIINTQQHFADIKILISEVKYSQPSDGTLYLSAYVVGFLNNLSTASTPTNYVTLWPKYYLTIDDAVENAEEEYMFWRLPTAEQQAEVKANVEIGSLLLNTVEIPDWFPLVSEELEKQDPAIQQNLEVFALLNDKITWELSYTSEFRRDGKNVSVLVFKLQTKVEDRIPWFVAILKTDKKLLPTATFLELANLLKLTKTEFQKIRLKGPTDKSVPLKVTEWVQSPLEENIKHQIIKEISLRPQKSLGLERCAVTFLLTFEPVGNLNATEFVHTNIVCKLTFGNTLSGYVVVVMEGLNSGTQVVHVVSEMHSNADKAIQTTKDQYLFWHIPSRVQLTTDYTTGHIGTEILKACETRARGEIAIQSLGRLSTKNNGASDSKAAGWTWELIFSSNYFYNIGKQASALLFRFHNTETNEPPRYAMVVQNLEFSENPKEGSSSTTNVRSIGVSQLGFNISNLFKFTRAEFDPIRFAGTEEGAILWQDSPIPGIELADTINPLLSQLGQGDEDFDYHFAHTMKIEFPKSLRIVKYGLKGTHQDRIRQTIPCFVYELKMSDGQTRYLVISVRYPESTKNEYVKPFLLKFVKVLFETEKDALDRVALPHYDGSGQLS